MRFQTVNVFKFCLTWRASEHVHVVYKNDVYCIAQIYYLLLSTLSEDGLCKMVGRSNVNCLIFCSKTRYIFEMMHV